MTSPPSDPTLSDPAPPPSGGAASEPSGGTGPAAPSRTRLLGVVTLVLAVVVTGLGWLFWSEGAPPPRPPVALESLPRVDGTLTVVERDRLVMKPFRPVDGRAELEFALVEEYRQYFDLAHMRSHAAVGIPTRIYYVERAGRLVAVYKADAPVNSSPSGAP